MLATSHDGKWLLARRGREVVVHAVDGTSLSRAGTYELASESDELVFVGPPAVLARISHAHAPVPTRVELIGLQRDDGKPGPLAAVARIDLQDMRTLACVTGPRMVLLDPARKDPIVVRTAGTGLGAQPLDTGGLAVELVLPLLKQQVLLALPKHAMVYDAVSSRPLGRSGLPLPPPPRHGGGALGHAWITTASTGDIVIYRLSDGRPFPHVVSASIQAVVAHPGTPVIVLVTAQHLVRVHCLAHSMAVIEAPHTPGGDLALLPHGANGEDVSLVGLAADAPAGTLPWQVPVGRPLR